MSTAKLGAATVLDAATLTAHMTRGLEPAKGTHTLRSWDAQRATLRDRLELYLMLKLIEPVDSARKLREETLSLQKEINSLLRRVLNGEDVRTVFAIDKKKRGLKSSPARQLAAVHEVARLVHAGHDRVEMQALVAEAFSTAPRSVERWCSLWSDRAVDVPRYLRELKAAKLL